MTLLTNDGTLPLSGDEDVFVGGPNADEMIHQLGGWSVADPEGVPGKTVREALGDATTGEVTHVPGTTLNEACESPDEDVDAAVAAAADADVAVLAVGEGWYLHEFGPAATAGTETGEWPTRRDLGLAATQRELVRRVHEETDTPVVTVLVTGRPLAVEWIAEHVPALLLAYFPGTEGGVAVAETLFENDPSGRLPVTIPRDAGDLPQHHDHLAHPTPIGEDEHPDSYDSLFPFGHGLSYADFETGGLEASVDSVEASADSEQGAVPVRVEVENRGERAGTETVQVYARQKHASRVRPVRSLVGFERVRLAPDKAATVEVTIPRDRLGFYRPRDGHVVEDGEYRIDVDDESTTIRL